MRPRTFLGIVIIVFLVAVLGLFAYELYSLVTSAQVPSPPVTAPATLTAVASPSPMTSPTPTLGQSITQCAGYFAYLFHIKSANDSSPSVFLCNLHSR
jgi:hypothetical protein